MLRSDTPRQPAGLRPVLALSLLALGAAPARAQCEGWDPDFGVRGANAAVHEFAIFDDGTGPALYAGGGFGSIGGGTASRVARWDGSAWSEVPGMQPFVLVLGLEALDDGSGEALYACGSYVDSTTGTLAAGVWRRSGGGWLPVGSGPTAGSATDVAVHDDGSGPKLHRGVHGQGSSRVQRYDAPNWTDVVVVDGPLHALAVYADGLGAQPALYIGGAFQFATPAGAGGIPVQTRGLARWDGVAVSSTGGLGGAGIVEELRVLDNGSGPALYVGGQFSSAGLILAANVARRQGAVWQSLGAGVSGRVAALAAFDDGGGRAVYVSGVFSSAGGTPAANVARFKNGFWSALGAGITVGAGFGDGVWALAVHDDGTDGDTDLYAGGNFTAAGRDPATRLARWNGCATSSFCAGDGSLAACPCANSGVLGRGCENSASTGGALLQATGSSHPDQLVLTSSGELAGAFSIFLQGDVDGAPTAFGDGLRCAGGDLKRLYAKNASAGAVSAPQAGDPSITARSAALGDPIAPGTDRFYQVYYRDPDRGFCPGPQGSTFNASNALRVIW
jgi:hypothetical protein